jgi:hypothetical protein
MKRVKLFGTLAAGLCFVTGTIAAAEPATKPAPKKHPECQETKHKTTCNKQAEFKDFVTSRQAPSQTGPAADGQQTPASNAEQGTQPAKDSPNPQQPR